MTAIIRAIRHIIRVLLKPKCEHKNTSWYIKRYEDQKVNYINLSGETRYLYCDDCEKELKSSFFQNFDGS